MEASPNPIPLSGQESRVIDLSMQGLGDKEIAHEMGLSVGTVRTYWKRIQSKVGGHTRAEIVSVVARLKPEQALLEERRLTARLKEEIKQRREAEARFRAICSCSPVGIYVTNSRGECTYVNPSWERITGLSFASAMGFEWKSMLHADDYDQVMAWWNDHYQGKSACVPIEMRLVTPEKTLWIRSSMARMEIDGRFLGLVGTVEDVTVCPARDRAGLAIGC